MNWPIHRRIINLLKRPIFSAGEANSPIRAAGPDVMLSARVGLPLAMVMHELATNAAKYGALSTPAGQVALGWTLARKEDGNRLSLDWRESGGPPVVQPNRRGFGSRLMERTLGKDLQGKVELRFLPSGLQCLLAFALTANEGQ